MTVLRMDIEQDVGSPEMTLTVVAGKIRVEVEIPDARRPVPITPEDRAVMQTVRAALSRMGAARGMLYGRYADYFLWALAQHVQYTRQQTAPTLSIAGIEVSTRLPPGHTALPHVKQIGAA